MLENGRLDRSSALRDERRRLLRFCSGLTDDEWFARSAADGWRVKDVVAHLGGGCHALLSPAAVAIMRSSDVERTNDVMVDARRDWAPRDVLDEFARWSARAIRLQTVVAATPLTALRMPVAELGRFPIGLLLSGALVFDMHTHLGFDVAPALGREAPPTDHNRMSLVVEWMLAVLENQLRSTPARWRDRTVLLVLAGPGGGRWSISRDGDILAGGSEELLAAKIFAVAAEFPEWATARASWRDREVTVEGEVEYGARFLDAVNVV